MKLPEIIKKRKYIVITIIILIVGGYYWYSKSKSTSTQVRYVTQAAEKGTLTTSISGSGNVIVDQSSNIDPTITGTVADLAVNVGDKAAKGQFLFSIINDDLSVSAARSLSSYKQALSSLESAKATKKQAKYDYEHNTSGEQQKIVLRQKLKSAEAGVLSAEQSLISARTDLANQNANAAKRKVTSPIDGTVNAINIKNGDDLSKLSSGSSRQIPIIIGDLDTLKAQVEINEVDISSVSIGQKVTLTLNAIDGFTTTGEIEKMDSLGTLISGVVTYNVTVVFSELDPRIKPEMSVTANIITDTKQDVLIVPSSSIKTQGEKSYVEVLNEKTPEKKNIVTGTSNSTDTEIISGISKGDKVITQTINSSSPSSSSSSLNSRSNSTRIPGLGGFGR